jgi:phosphoesterase RecJ-like protein
MIASLKEYLRSFHHIVIASHVYPDGDALGSSLALWGALKALGCKVSVVNATEKFENKYSFLEGFSAIKREVPSSCDCVVLVDCSSVSRTKLEFPSGASYVVIDHHVTSNSLSQWDCIDLDACSTTAVLFELFESWQISVTPHIATALYVGIAEDTNFFQKRMNAKVFETVTSLVRMGANGNEISKRIEQHHSLAKLRLRGIALKNFELLASGSVAFVYLSKEMFEATGATFYDSEGIADELIALAVAQMSVVIRFNGGASFKVSLRSKKKEVYKIATMFGGGGHLLSGGFEIACNDEDEYKIVRDKIIELIQGD